MKKIIHNIARWLVTLTEKRSKANEDYTTFIQKGNNGLIIVLVLFGSFFVYWAYELYRDYGKFWLALIPLVFLALLIFGSFIRNAYEDELRNRRKGTSLKLVGFNMDFNRRILQRIYSSLTRYEYLDENRTTFEDFHDVMVLDFDEHNSVVHFSCTQAELKYILEKFKPFKKGLYLSTFEHSEKIYNKEELVTAKSFYSNYSDNPPTRDFEKLIDSFFDF